MRRIGIIDIGSNSVRYMEAECTSKYVHSLFKSVHTTRLAEGQDQEHILQDAPMRRTAEVINALADQAMKKQIQVYAYATSAVREAKNKSGFLSLITPVLKVKVLSGDEEGRLAYDGATGGKGTLIDIGGGSMQVVTERASFSAPAGCVRFKDLFDYGTPTELFHAAASWVIPKLDEVPETENHATGVGGTITTIGALQLDQHRFDGKELGKTVITLASLEVLTEHLFAMGESRKLHPLLVDRHDVILHGCALLHTLMAKLTIESVTPSDRDGMEGFAMYVNRTN